MRNQVVQGPAIARLSPDSTETSPGKSNPSPHAQGDPAQAAGSSSGRKLVASGGPAPVPAFQVSRSTSGNPQMPFAMLGATYLDERPALRCISLIDAQERAPHSSGCREAPVPGIAET